MQEVADLLAEAEAADTVWRLQESRRRRPAAVSLP